MKMLKSPKGQLRNKIRDVILNSRNQVILTSEIVDRVIAENPKLIDQEKMRLIKASLSQIVGKVMHTSTTGDQLSLPLGDSNFGLPSRIPVRIGAKNGPANWKKPVDLTYGQLKQRIKELRAKLVPSPELVRLIEFEKIAKPHLRSGADSEPLAPVFKKLQKAMATG